MSSMNISRTAEIKLLAKTSRDQAEQALAHLLSDLFDLNATNVHINYDQYSLNSLNGFFDVDDEAFFFKFHQEEGEQEMAGEYYRAEILSEAGLRVDLPVLASTLPGEQILIYRRRNEPRFSDVLRALDLDDDENRRSLAVEAERRLSRELFQVYEATLHAVTADEVAKEPINQLFYYRMVNPVSGCGPAGRLADFYVGKAFSFPGLTLSWDDLKDRRFVINGQRYLRTLGELFDASMLRLRPEAMTDAGGVVAHGDAHNANVWFIESEGSAKLSFFDPAFAGRHIPTLLAEVKATFHNVFAHPLWLYEPALVAQTYRVEGHLTGDEIHVSTDWQLSPVRKALLDVKSRELWKPLLATLASRDLLPADWETFIRLGLFLCPTLVMNLRAGVTSHTAQSSLLAWAIAVMVGSAPETGGNIVTEFFREIDPHRRQTSS